MTWCSGLSLFPDMWTKAVTFEQFHRYWKEMCGYAKFTQPVASMAAPRGDLRCTGEPPSGLRHPRQGVNRAVPGVNLRRDAGRRVTRLAVCPLYTDNAATLALAALGLQARDPTEVITGAQARLG